MRLNITGPGGVKHHYVVSDVNDPDGRATVVALEKARLTLHADQSDAIVNDAQRATFQISGRTRPEGQRTPRKTRR